MRAKSLYAAVLTALLVALAGCAPRAAPVPAPTPVSPKAAPAAPAPSVPSLSPEDVAWQKVVSEAKKEGKVTLYTTGLTGDKATSVSKAFGERYGIKLELIPSIATVHIERIKSEHRAGKYVADTLDSATSLVNMAKEEGLTVSVGDLPVLREKDVWMALPPKADPEGHLIGWKQALYPLYINTNLVKPGQEPRSYREFLEPRWRADQLTFSSPVTTPNIIWIYLATRKAGTLDDDFWRRLGLKGVKIAPSLRENPIWLSRGEVAMSIDTAEHNMAPYVKEGAPVKALEMVEGVTMLPLGTAFSLIKNGPHPNAARVFINWLLSQEGQQVFNEAAGGVYPLRKDNADLRPASIKLEIKKPLILDLATTLEATKVQREGTLTKLLGLER